MIRLAGLVGTNKKKLSEDEMQFQPFDFKYYQEQIETMSETLQTMEEELSATLHAPSPDIEAHYLAEMVRNELIKKIMLTGNLKAITQNIGMFMSHFGLAIFILGATMVENSKTEKEIVVALNEKLDIKNYTFQFMNITESEGPNYTAVIGHFKIYDNG